MKVFLWNNTKNCAHNWLLSVEFWTWAAHNGLDRPKPNPFLLQSSLAGSKQRSSIISLVGKGVRMSVEFWPRRNKRTRGKRIAISKQVWCGYLIGSIGCESKCMIALSIGGETQILYGPISTFGIELRSYKTRHWNHSNQIVSRAFLFYFVSVKWYIKVFLSVQSMFDTLKDKKWHVPKIALFLYDFQVWYGQYVLE